MGTAVQAPQAFRRYVGLSVALHAAALALALALAALRAPAPLPPVLAVTLLARVPGGASPGPVSAPPLPSAAPALSAPAPSAPAPQRVVLRKQPAPRPVPRREVPKQALAPAPLREAPPTPPAAPGAEAAAAPTPAPGTGSAGGGAERASLGPGSGGAPDGLGPTGGADPVALYQALVRARIQAERRYSPMARRRGLEGVVTVRLQLGASGEVARLVVEDGAPLLLARSTEEAVARAGPFPPPPTGLGVLRIPVRYRLTD